VAAAIIPVALEQSHDMYDQDRFCVSVKKGEQIVGHVPQ